MKKTLLSFVLMLMTSVMWAYDVEVDGIYYNIVEKAKTAEVTKGDNTYSGDITIPSSFSYSGVKYSVTSIGSSAFYGCSLTSITIPNSVTSIGNSAFKNCRGLTSIIIPNSVTKIGNNAFDSCSGLTSITIPQSVIIIGREAFYNCSNISSVNIEDLASWCNISFDCSPPIDESNPLSYAQKLLLNGVETKELVIPNSVTKIKSYAFYDCKCITSVTIPNSVTSIGNYGPSRYFPWMT